MLESLGQVVQEIVNTLHYPGLFFLIVLESTMIPVPSLLVMPFAGYLASPEVGVFSLPVILVINSAGAMTGSLLSYWFGAAGGKPLLLKYGKYIFVRPKDIEKTERFFATHGKWTVLIGRFLPVIRHIISIPAGVARMKLSTFITQTFIGSTVWGGGLMVLGYVVGDQWKPIVAKAKRVDVVFAALIVVAILVVVVRFVLRRRRERTFEASGTQDTAL
ncbi:MAG: DedA family protein [Kofleriaceae bacterium]